MIERNEPTTRRAPPLLPPYQAGSVESFSVGLSLRRDQDRMLTYWTQPKGSRCNPYHGTGLVAKATRRILRYNTNACVKLRAQYFYIISSNALDDTAFVAARKRIRSRCTACGLVDQWRLARFFAFCTSLGLCPGQVLV